MKKIVTLSIIGAALVGCSSQNHDHHHSQQVIDNYHDHQIIYEDQLTEFEKKDFNSFLCLANGQLESRISITTEGDYRIIKANNIPNHKTGNFARGGNPNTIKEQDNTYKMLLTPKFAAKPTKSFPNAFGVALNGVFFEPSTAEFWQGNRDWNEEAISHNGRRNLGLDENYAHVQPGGSYHYHGVPTGLVKNLAAKKKGKMMHIGYAADGFPIYSQYGYTDAKNNRSRVKKLSSSYKLKKGKRPK